MLDETVGPFCGFNADELAPWHYGGIEKLLAKYFEIDLNKAEDERVAILDHLRELHAKREKEA